MSSTAEGPNGPVGRVLRPFGVLRGESWSSSILRSSSKTFVSPLGIGLKRFLAIGKGSTASESTSSIASASLGRETVRPMSRSSTNTEIGWFRMVRVPTHREPTHPGEMLLEEFLEPMGISQRDLAEGIRVPYQRVNELVNRRRGITPSTALRLSRYFGNSAGFWLTLQHRWDLYQTMKDEAVELKRIHQVHVQN